MPNFESRGSNPYSQYDNMTNAELEEILRLDAHKPEGEESDIDTLLYVMEVLAQRKKNSDNPGKDPEEAFRSFKANYMSIDPDEDMPQEEAQSKIVPLSRKKCRWLRSLTGVAAAIAIVFFSSMTANAFGFDIWEIVVKWSQETFHFGEAAQTEGSEPIYDDEGEYTSLQDALEQNQITAQLTPTWLPDGFEFTDILIDESPVQRRFVARYRNGEQEIKIQIIDHLRDDAQQIEQSDSLLEVYKSSGVAYYIFNNYDLLRAVWINENYECYISGHLSVEELKLMIDSITKE